MLSEGINCMHFTIFAPLIVSWFCLTVKIGMLYLLSGFGGSLMSCLSIRTKISVGASGALFGLLGAMLSELIMNWTIYANKVTIHTSLQWQYV